MLDLTEINKREKRQ